MNKINLKELDPWVDENLPAMTPEELETSRKAFNEAVSRCLIGMLSDEEGVKSQFVWDGELFEMTIRKARN